MGARQHANPDGNRPHGAGVAAINAWLTGQDAPAHDLAFQRRECAFNRLRGPALRFLGQQLGEGLIADVAHPLLAGQLISDLVRLGQRGFGGGAGCLGQHGVANRRLPVPRLDAGLDNQLLDGANCGLHLLVAEHHRTEHHVFRQLLGFGLHHQHRPLGARHHQIQLRGFQFLAGRVEQVLTVVVTDPGRANRAVERHAGQRYRRRGAQQRRNFRVHLIVQRHHGGDDLQLVREAVGKQRAQWPINQPGGQGFAFGWTALAPEKAAGNAACRVSTLLVIHPQGQEVPAFLGFPGGDHGHQHHGVGHVDHHRATGLPGDFARFQRHGMLAVLKCLLDGRHESVLCGERAMENLSGAGRGG